jgi:2,4-dichlorophenol 6-monooxygenase
MVSIPDENSKWMTPSGLFCADWSTIVKMGPTWTKHSEEWALHFSLGQLHCPLETLTDEDMKLWTRKTLKLPNLELEILKTSRWNFEGVFAKQYQTNRIFLAGDAVHRHPPTTGLGLNTAIGDAHNLTWKLAAVLRGQAPPSFLKSYETERQPIGKRNTQWALHTLMSFRQIDTAVSLLPGGKDIRPVNEGIFNQMLADTFDGLARRAAFQYAIGGQRIEYAAHDLEIGGVYENGALVPDGTSAPPADPLGQRYDPSTRPGHRLPHAWLRGAHTRISTHHLLSRDGTWVLLTDDSAVAEQWVNAAAKMSKRHSLKIVTARIGPNGDYKGEDEQWTSVSELEPAAGGMVLVRPDAYVAFRVKRFSATVLEQFEDAIVAILAIESTK